MKKKIGVILSLLLINSNVYAAEILVNDEMINTEAIIVEGRTLVPVRGVFEKLGYTVEWDNESKTATLNNNNMKIIIKNDETSFTANGKQVSPDVAQQIIDSKFYLPLRAVSEAIGADVEWDNNTKTVIINSQNVSSKVDESSKAENNNNPNIENRVDINDDIGINNYSYYGLGLATICNGYIYYSSTSEEEYNNTIIYKMNLDGTNKTKVVTMINGEGNGTYFKSYDNEIYFFDNWHQLCKIDTKNNKFYEVVKSSNKGEYLKDDFYLNDGFLYYAKSYFVPDSEEEKYSIYQKEISSGKEKEILTEFINIDSRINFEIRGNKIYLRSSNYTYDETEDSDIQTIKYEKLNLDGSNREDDNLEIGGKTIHNNKNYSSSEILKTLKPFSSDSNETISILNIKNDIVYFTTEYWDSVNERKDGIYRSSFNEDKSNKTIYKMSIGSDNYTKIVDGEKIEAITLVGDWIFYMDNGVKYMVKTDGSSKSKL